MIKNWKGLIGFVVFTLVLVSGTGLAQTHKLSLGTLKGPLNALVPVAIDGGFFAREGLEVTEKIFPISPLALNEILEGKIDLAVTSDTALAMKAFDRQDFMVLAEVGSADNFVKILARKDRGIQKAQDFRGKKIGLAKGSSFEFFLYLYLLRQGIPAKEVTIINCKPDELVKALQAGTIDAYVERPNYINQGIKIFGDHAVVLSSPGLYRTVVGLTAGKDYVLKNPALILKVLKALKKAEEKIAGNPDLPVQVMSGRLKISEEKLRTEIEGFEYELSLNQGFILGLEAQARWIIRNRMTEKQKIPNFLEIIYLNGLKGIKPQSVSIIK